jgi:hypothetical protein
LKQITNKFSNIFAKTKANDPISDDIFPELDFAINSQYIDFHNMNQYPKTPEICAISFQSRKFQYIRYFVLFGVCATYEEAKTAAK